MNVITAILDDSVSEHHVQFIKRSIESRLNYLQQNKNNNKIFMAIDSITDVDLLKQLTDRCNEIQAIFEYDNNQNILMENINKIKNAHKNPLLKNIRKFNKREMNLLHTLNVTNRHCILKHCTDFCTLHFILNGKTYKFTWKSNHIHGCCLLINETVIFDEYGNWCDNRELRTNAFMAKLTIYEFKRFMANLLQIFQHPCAFIGETRHKFSYKPTINITNLLLCSVNEQYDKNISYANMSKADLVFYDEYLLKCITSIR